MKKHKNIPSGRFVLRAGPALHSTLRRGAKEAGLSLNEYCLKILNRGIPSSISPQIPEPLWEGRPVLRDILRQFEDRLETIVLFGSKARGEAWQDSDVDLLLVLRRGYPLTRACYTEWDQNLSALTDMQISPQFVQFPTQTENVGGLWLEVAIDGRVLWDPAGEVTRVMSRLRNDILSGRWRRRNIHGQGYWEREELKHEE